MGDENEWNDLKSTAVHEFNKSLDKKHPINTDNALLRIPNKYVYKRKIDGVSKKVTMYSSNYFCGFAVNAIDNTLYNIRIGSNNEKYLFSVRFVAEKFKDREHEVLTLYYDNPQAYEKHHGVSLDKKIISKWYDTFNKLPVKRIYTTHIIPDVFEPTRETYTLKNEENQPIHVIVVK
jgi:hypothetical protein